MQNIFLSENSSGIIEFILGDKGLPISSKDIIPKGDVIARLDFELALKSSSLSTTLSYSDLKWSGIFFRVSVVHQFIILLLLAYPKSIFPVGRGCRIRWLHLCRGLRPPPTSVLNMILNHAGILGNVEKPFVTNTSWSTHTRNGITHHGPIWIK